MDDQEKKPSAEFSSAEEEKICSDPQAETSRAAGSAPESAERNGEPAAQPEKKKGFKVWWQNHKPTQRRLIQVYAALLFNINFKGFFTGEMYRGPVKSVCVPGMNCYSCPGASGACPLGSLQNALAHRSAEHRSAFFYVIGIILLYAVLLGRTICGFLCPVGLGQELLYKIKTPKLKKNRVTHILSYFKYVLLAVLVIAVPLLFSFSDTVIPGFCKYICPAGTFGGGIGLLLHPSNAGLFEGLGILFTWKFILMVIMMVACVFIFRFFCRFFCPLGAIYGFFNKISLLGVKLDQNKCTDCGLCVSHCKMDVKHVGDHECINCGDCIRICPAHAISWKGSKLLLHKSAVEAEVAVEEKPLAGMLEKRSAAAVAAGETQGESFVREEIAVSVSYSETPAGAQGTSEGTKTKEKRPKKHDKVFFLKIAAWTLALIVFAGAFVYYNFLDKSSEAGYVPTGTEHRFSILANSEGTLAFRILGEGEEGQNTVEPYSGDGTEESPYILSELFGTYVIESVTPGQTIWYSYSSEDTIELTLRRIGTWNENSTARFSLSVYAYSAESGEFTPSQSASMVTSETITFEAGVAQGYMPGMLLYDFTLDVIGNDETYTLSKHRGKIIVINFWYTTCGPCVGELPSFQQVKQKYGDEVEVIAIHQAGWEEQEVVDWINAKEDILDTSRTWGAWDVTFLMDRGNKSVSEIYTLLGGRSNSYPMTLIIDENGFVKLWRQASMEQATLENTIDDILAARENG